ncbi:MAG TPA: radical SAM protein [Pyrinomonadaceae bacterium]|nr:radical SAM protein [Pyrinomonadaceae bacterium]
MKKPKAYLNVLKLRLNMALKREAVNSYPVVAFIEPNLYCNLQCPACPTGLRLGLRPTVAIEEELFRATIDQIGDYIFQLYMYNWGEPLLHKRTPEMIAYAKKKDINILLSTNLSIKLTDDYIDRLVSSGLDRMLVSLDGVTQETYSKYRVRGDIELVRENALRIQRAKQRLGSATPKVVWQFLVFRHNEHEIEQARAVYKEWGADEFIVGGAEMPMEPYNAGFEPSTIPEYNVYHPDHPSQKEAERQLTSDRACAWLYGVFVLNPNGKVSPCCAVPSEKLDFGEYHKGDFFGVWNNETFRRARRMFAATPGKKPRQPRTLTTEQKVKISERIDGMALRVVNQISEDKLICHRCPIPFLQNYTDPIIAEVATAQRQGAAHASSLTGRARHLMNYMLMGGPTLAGTWRTRALAKKLLSLRAPQFRSAD